jgi:diaminopimelate epimerase
MRFEKWQALGNDYVIVEADALPWELTPERIRRICAPHLGVGSDGILLLSRASDPAHVAELRIFNPDGSEAELSGNGAREAVLYLRARGWAEEDEFSILTKAGEIRPRITGPDVATLEMGSASVTSPDFPSGGPDGQGTLSAGGREWRFQHVSIGNPQCAIEVGAEIEDLDLGRIGPEIEHSPLFPNRTNVSFFRVDGSTVRARIFERGVGETLSSGTGASGAAVAAHLRGAASPITVMLDGGELTVEISDGLAVRLTGTAEPVYSAVLSERLVRELDTA